jgi:hypothetical protein
MTCALLTEGLIDSLEQFYMDVMANAAYLNAIEELQILKDKPALSGLYRYFTRFGR